MPASWEIIPLHSFRVTGITNYLENGGTLEVAQRIAGHADSRTTKLYDRRGQEVMLLEDMERIPVLNALIYSACVSYHASSISAQRLANSVLSRAILSAH
jgi:hypothetical protein